MKRGKVYFTVVMSGLTLTAITACRWQTRRYYESTERWTKITSAFEKFDPQPLESGSMPSYSLVQVKGKFGKGEAHVMRVKGGRAGFMVIKAFHLATPLADGSKTILVNAGWIPEDLGMTSTDIATDRELSRDG